MKAKKPCEQWVPSKVLGAPREECGTCGWLFDEHGGKQ